MGQLRAEQFLKANRQLGRNLVELRKSKGWTALEAAEKLSFSAGYLYQIEKGFPPSFKRLILLKRVYNCKWSVILKGVR